MSLTSYRAAPPRVGGCVWCLEDLAATDFPAPCGAVSWALGVFTSEFGMGSGGGSPPWPPGRPSACGGVWVVLVGLCCAVWFMAEPAMIAVHGGCHGACWAIRTSQLHALRHFHTWPIDVMVCHGPSGIAPWETWF